MSLKNIYKKILEIKKGFSSFKRFFFPGQTSEYSLADFLKLSIASSKFSPKSAIPNSSLLTITNFFPASFSSRTIMFKLKPRSESTIQSCSSILK